jgi:Fe2+ transport system protein FeoA
MIKNLSIAKTSEELEITSIKASQDLLSTLGSMGIYTGAVIKILQKHKNGSLVVAKNNTRLAISNNIAMQIKCKVFKAINIA